MIGFLRQVFNGVSSGSEKEYSAKNTYTAVVIFMQPLVTLCGIGLEIAHFQRTGQFDLNAYFQATATWFVGLGLFLAGHSASDYFANKSAPKDPPNV